MRRPALILPLQRAFSTVVVYAVMWGSIGLHVQRHLVGLGWLRLRRLLEGLRGRRHPDLCAIQQAFDGENLDAAIILVPAGRVTVTR